MRRVILILLVLAMTLGMAACTPIEQNPAASGTESKVSGETGENTSSQEENADPAGEDNDLASFHQEGMEVTELTVAIMDPDTLLPWKVTDPVTAMYLWLIYEPLWDVAEDQSLAMGLATSVTMGAGGGYVDVALNEQAVFHNGKKLTNQDVIYSIEKLMETENAYSEAVRIIDRVSAQGKGVRIFLKEKGYIGLFSMVFPIVPKDLEEDLHPVGTGPYQFERLEKDREMTLTKNPSYHWTKIGIDTVRIFFVRDESAIETSFSTGRTNLFFPTELEWGRYINQTGRTIHDHVSDDAIYLVFNPEGSFASSYSNRQKMVRSLDNDKILQMGFWGRGEATGLPFHLSSWYAKELNDPYLYDPEGAANMETDGYHTILIYYDETDPILTAILPEITEELEASSLAVRIVTTEESADVILRRGRLTLKEAAAVLGMETSLRAAISATGIERTAAAMAEKVEKDLLLYTLFYLYDGTITGYGIQGELSPSNADPYRGVDQLY